MDTIVRYLIAIAAIASALAFQSGDVEGVHDAVATRQGDDARARA